MRQAGDAVQAVGLNQREPIARAGHVAVEQCHGKCAVKRHILDDVEQPAAAGADPESKRAPVINRCVLANRYQAAVLDVQRARAGVSTASFHTWKRKLNAEVAPAESKTHPNRQRKKKEPPAQMASLVPVQVVANTSASDAPVEAAAAAWCRSLQSLPDKWFTARP